MVKRWCAGATTAPAPEPAIPTETELRDQAPELRLPVPQPRRGTARTVSRRDVRADDRHGRAGRNQEHRPAARPGREFRVLTGPDLLPRAESYNGVGAPGKGVQAQERPVAKRPDVGDIHDDRRVESLEPRAGSQEDLHPILMGQEPLGFQRPRVEVASPGLNESPPRIRTAIRPLQLRVNDEVSVRFARQCLPVAATQRLICPANDLDVLLRHRPPSIPRGGWRCRPHPAADRRVAQRREGVPGNDPTADDA
jgi:hypothetical protein